MADVEYDSEPEIEERNSYYDNNETDLYYAMKEGQHDYSEWHNSDDEHEYVAETNTLITYTPQAQEERQRKKEQQETIRSLVRTKLPVEIKQMISKWL
jgi:hypothetical protein